MCIGIGDSGDEYVQQFLMIDLALSFKKKTKDDLDGDLITNCYSPTNHGMHIL
jgi:hypothetical protein